MFQKWSLKFWIAMAMMIAVAPVVAASFVGHVLLSQGVITSYKDVSRRLYAQITPLQDLRLHLLAAIVPVDEFAGERRDGYAEAYRASRSEIEDDFAGLIRAMKDEPGLRDIVMSARQDWREADGVATNLFSGAFASGTDAEKGALKIFHGNVLAMVDRLEAVGHQLARVVAHDHVQASIYHERTLWIISISFLVASIAVVASVALISRLMASSVDRLVDGALRFASGERDHRINISVPPELGRVAEEFNHMIERIHDSEEALSELARRDVLTGLPNRREFDEMLREMRARAERFGEQWCLLAIDVDYFKTVNDTYGHAAGDEVLKAVGTLMNGAVRPYDRVYRTGGEEFSVVLEKTDAVTAMEVAQRLRRALEGLTVQYNDVEIAVTVSIGIAQYDLEYSDKEFIERADRALYRAKAAGRNCVVVDEGGAPRGKVAADVRAA